MAGHVGREGGRVADGASGGGAGHGGRRGPGGGVGPGGGDPGAVDADLVAGRGGAGVVGAVVVAAGQVV